MNDAAIKRRIDELCDIIARSPKAGAEGKPAAGADKQPEDGTYVAGASKEDTGVEGALDNLRLRIKYAAFDLEATRRENRYLRQMLESRPKPGGDEPKGNGGDSGKG